MLRISNNNSNSCYCCCCWLLLAGNSRKVLVVKCLCLVLWSSASATTTITITMMMMMILTTNFGIVAPRTRISMKKIPTIYSYLPSFIVSSSPKNKTTSLRPFAQLLYQANICFALSGCLIFSLCCIILGCEGQLRPDKRWVVSEWIGLDWIELSST